MGEPLKPCMFCDGANARVYADRLGSPKDCVPWFVRCEVCGARGPTKIGQEKDGTAAWNRRAPLSPEIREALERVLPVAEDIRGYGHRFEDSCRTLRSFLAGTVAVSQEGKSDGR